MMSPLRWCSAILLFALVGMAEPAASQSVDVGGRMYVDYFYNFADPAAEAEDLHGFQYRRLYLTTDFTLSEVFSGRARLEAPEDVPGGSGVAVKDLWLTWQYSGEHSATIGVTPPPAFGLTQDVWGYRSLARTVMDRQDIVDSRDLGVRVDGPLFADGTVRYAAMIANNSNTRFTETDRYKRAYGQIQVRPTDPLLFVVGGDYTAFPDERTRGIRLSGLIGYSTDTFRVGLETYWYRLRRATADARTNTGGSLFGSVQVASAWEVIGRVDRVWPLGKGPDRYDTLVVTGIAYRPHPTVALIPNLRLEDRDDGPARTTGRVTLEVDF